MPFTAQELTNIANAALDFYIKGPAMAQSIQKRPTLDAFKSKQKTFPGGKADIRQIVGRDRMSGRKSATLLHSPESSVNPKP